VDRVQRPEPLYKYWTEYEVGILKDYLERGESWRFIEEKFPHRTIEAIQQKAYSLGLTTKTKNPHTGIGWRKYELDVVRIYGDRLDCKDIKKYFLPHRTINDIWSIKRYYESLLD
jgi:hypothetical protein